MVTQLAVCGRCEARWFGMKPAHCVACHRTFTVMTAFDAHRRNGRCRTPEACGLVASERGGVMFGYPATEKGAQFFAAVAAKTYQPKKEGTQSR